MSQLLPKTGQLENFFVKSQIPHCQLAINQSIIYFEILHIIFFSKYWMCSLKAAILRLAIAIGCLPGQPWIIGTNYSLKSCTSWLHYNAAVGGHKRLFLKLNRIGNCGSSSNVRWGRMNTRLIGASTYKAVRFYTIFLIF